MNNKSSKNIKNNKNQYKANNNKQSTNLFRNNINTNGIGNLKLFNKSASKKLIKTCKNSKSSIFQINKNNKKKSKRY